MVGKSDILNLLKNLPGFRTSRKIVVIESDDWGSIRMPSGQVSDKLLKKGLIRENDPYSRLDTLADEDDLNHLFEVLGKHKDKNNATPCRDSKFPRCKSGFR